MTILNGHTRRCDLCASQFETDEQLQNHWERTHEAETVGVHEDLPDAITSLL